MTTFTRRAFAHSAAALLVATCLVPLSAHGSAATSGAGSVTLTVTYTGKGVVDEGHQVWIWLFDTPDIGPGAIPIREESISKNGDSVTLRDLSEARVWVVVAYDERGGFTGSAPPVSGSPIGFYSADGRGPSALSAAEHATASVTFDDAQRMP